MSKLINRAIICVLAVIATACLMFTAACGSQGTKTVTYTVSVSLADGSAATDTEVYLVKGSAKNGPYWIDSTGEVQITIEGAEYDIQLDNIPEGYTYAKTVKTAATGGKVSITLSSGSQNLGGNGTEFDRYRVKEGSWSVVMQEAGMELFYSFKPSKTGRYAVYSTGDYDTVLEDYAASIAYIHHEGTYDDKSQTDKNFYFEWDVRNEYFYKTIVNSKGESVTVPADEYEDVFGVKVKGEGLTYPISFNITFERVGDVLPDPNTYIDVMVEDNQLPIYQDAPAGYALKAMPYGDVYYFNEGDGYYHYGSQDGPIILVRLEGNNRYSDSDFKGIYAEGGNSFTYSEKKQDSDGYNVYNYNSYIIYELLGYNTQVNDIGEIDFTENGRRRINKDGVYPCNRALFNVINDWVKKTGYYAQGVPNEYQWLCFCYYYKNLGVGTEQNPYVIEDLGRRTVTVEADQTVYFTLENANGRYTVSSSKAGAKGVYGGQEYGDEQGFTFTTERTSDFTFAVKFTAGEGATFSFTVSEYTDGTEQSPYKISVGEHTASGVDGQSNEKFYIFTARTSGVYTVESDGLVILVETGEEVSEIVANQQNQSFFIKVKKADSADAVVGNVTFTITKKITAVYDQPESGSGTSADPYAIIGGVYMAELVGNGKISYYSFTATQSGVLTVAPADGETHAYITVKNGEKASVVVTTVAEIIEIAYGDVVMIEVTAYQVDDIEFTVSFKATESAEPDGSASRPYIAEIGREYTAQFSAQQDVGRAGKFYKLTVTKAGVYTVSSHTAGAILSVYKDSALAELVDHSGNFADYGYAYVSVTLEKGEYYVYVNTSVETATNVVFKIESK